eukprot:11221654-Lingulodinium_polyedra.AAC.1
MRAPPPARPRFSGGRPPRPWPRSCPIHPERHRWPGRAGQERPGQRVPGKGQAHIFSRTPQTQRPPRRQR